MTDPDVAPHPASERWQPLRLGLVDLFYYDDEQFWFHDGRLLLRGNNGTGKSKVLALTLPFLLDGSVHPRRVEPDADPKKRMEWNLLLGGAHPNPERTGYAWVEFGRVDHDGSEHFTTLGIGLKAAAGRGIVKTWYFLSTRRIGDLHLVDANRVVLTQERLRDELAATSSGQVFTTQDAYRRAVDEALFRLGSERYAALIDLLIQLRQPHLSKRPDEKALSAALTEALTPLDQAIVADVAESFRSLEEERSGIADAKDTLAAAEAFLKHYRGYARVAARRHTTAVREANSDYEWAGRHLREAEEALAAHLIEIDRLNSARVAAEERHSALQGEDRGLRESPEMRDADRLDRAGREAADAERRAGDAAAEAESAERRAARERDEARTAGEQWEISEQEHRRRSSHAERLAVPAGLSEEHHAAARTEDDARRLVARRREQVAHVRGLVEEARRSREHAQRRREALDATEAEAAERDEGVLHAQTAVEDSVAVYGAALQAYLAALQALVLDTDRDRLLDEAETWARSQTDRSPARAVVAAAITAAQGRLGQDRAIADQELTGVETELAAVRAEVADLEAGRDPEPAPTPGRDPQRRAGRAGAPLWRLTDFHGDVPEPDRAGLEAALESAGLLDAWVFPDGTVDADDDVVLGPGTPEVATSLTGVLVPAVGPDAPVPATAVTAVLGRIGYGESSGAPLWVDRSGCWGAGPARGSWSKGAPAYLGAGAREAHRRSRIAALAREIALLEDRRSQVRARIVELDDHARLVQEEAERYPETAERALATAHAEAAAAHREAVRAREAVEDARRQWESDERAAAAAEGELAEQAESLHLGTTAGALDATASALAEYAEALGELRSATRILAERAAARTQAEERAAEAVAIHERRASEAAEQRKQAATLRGQFDALEATVGASVADLQDRLRQVAEAIAATENSLQDIGQAQLAAASMEGTLREKVENLEQRRIDAAARRDATVVSLRTFATTGLLRVAVPELDVPDPDAEWGVTASVALSRLAEQHLDDADGSDDAWSRSQQRVSSASTELTSQMSRHGHTAYVEQHDDVLVARVRYLSDEIDVDELATRLEADIADRERLLSEREREILENHLVNEVAGHLHELLLTAENQIDGMNRELAERRTSTGMQLRVRWRERSDGPAGLATTRALMLRSDATWTATDRAAIGEFLQARIAQVRQADPSGAWQEHLEQALDYRQWHAFSVERLQNGQWRSASGPASGGEKVLAVSVPLFAAASAHYNSAGPLAPRLILLDEAFAGVDDDSRAKSLGLLATFDLDVVMTSEREWGCYPQVPGLAIAQLSRIEGVDAVGVTRWRWDGRRRERVVDIADGARAGIGTPGHDHDDSLFG